MAATLPPHELDRIRRTRRHPARTQPDYLILRYLVNHLERVLDEIRHPVDDVLDLYCGTQPYRDLVPRTCATWRWTSMIAMALRRDLNGVPPVPDASFDLILFSEAFHYVTDPARGVEELRRVLRPRGTLVLTVPLVWEYDRRIVERRYTGPHLAELFAGWDDVRVLENGGYSVAWATLTGRILRGIEELLPARARRPLRPVFVGAALALNFVATLLTKGEARWHTGPFVLPMGLLLTAGRPLD
jgi:SAM-dependent methyltransferase